MFSISLAFGFIVSSISWPEKFITFLIFWETLVVSQKSLWSPSDLFSTPSQNIASTWQQVRSYSLQERKTQLFLRAHRREANTCQKRCILKIQLIVKSKSFKSIDTLALECVTTWCCTLQTCWVLAAPNASFQREINSLKCMKKDRTRLTQSLILSKWWKLLETWKFCWRELWWTMLILNSLSSMHQRIFWTWTILQILMNTREKIVSLTTHRICMILQMAKLLQRI